MADSLSEREPIEELAESFLARFRAGERPPLTELVAAHPDLAEDIRALFPALIEMEQVGSAIGPVPGSVKAPIPLGGTALESLGEYRIIREIGRGGMGVVYEAVQESLGRHVALKIFAPWARTDPKMIERFQREAKAAARLHHTNIVPVFGVGEHDSYRYYVMQFIQGQGLDAILGELRRLRAAPAVSPGSLIGQDTTEPAPLATTVARSLLTGEFRNPAGAPGVDRSEIDYELCDPARPPAPSGAEVSSDASSVWASQPGGSYARTIARVGLQVAEALQHAHGLGILHRDIKPSNLLLDIAGNIWVTDFGLAKADDADDLTESGDVVGTARYIAPERFRGESSPQSDVYSLGATLYELLTLRPAFDERDRARLIDHILHGSPPALRTVNPEIPRDLETIVSTALAREPSSRYTNAEKLADDLRRFLSDRPVLARRSSAVEKTWRWCRRNPTLAGLGGLVSLLMLAGLVVLLVSNAMIRREQKRTLRQLYINRVNLAYREAAANNVLLADRLLAECPPELRGWEWEYCRRLCHSETRTLPGHDRNPAGPGGTFDSLAFAGVQDLAFSPDGETIASAGEDHLIRLRDAATGRDIRVLTGHRDIVRRLAFRPDGRQIASCGRDGTVRVWDVATGRELRLIEWERGRRVDSLAFSPDGRAIASASDVGQVRLTDAESGRDLWMMGDTHGLDQDAFSLAFSPDGRQIATGCFDGCVRQRDAATGREIRSLPIGGHGYCVRYSPDGRLLAAGAADGVIRVWDRGSGAEVRRMLGHGNSVYGLAFSLDGRWLASASWDRTIRLWDMATGDEVANLRGHTDRAQCVAFSPDGARLASGSFDRSIKLWQTTEWVDALVSRAEMGWREAVVFSSDGSKVAAGGYRQARIWDVRTGELLTCVAPETTIEVNALDFSADGRSLVTGSAGSNDLELWDAQSGRRLAVLSGHTGPVMAVKYSPVGTAIASAAEDGTIRLWKPSGQGPGDVLRGHVGAVMGVAFSPDGTRIGSIGSDRTVRLWDVGERRELQIVRGPVRGVNNHSGNPIAFSPFGQRLAAAGDDGAVLVWDLPALNPVLVLHGHTGQVFDVVFSPDGRRLATAGEDATVKLWDAADGAEVFTLRGHTGSVLGLDFSPDGRRLASASIDKTMRIWELDLPTEEVARRRWVVAQAERLLSRLPRDQAAARLGRDPTLTESVRGAAVSMAGRLPRIDPVGFSHDAWRIELSRRRLEENPRRAPLRAEEAELPTAPDAAMPNGRNSFAR
jgi:WD40 repeat protein/serine/threonine protein kinase